MADKRLSKILVPKMLLVFLLIIALVAIPFAIGVSADAINDGYEVSAYNDGEQLFVTFPATNDALSLIAYQEDDQSPGVYTEIYNASVADPSSGRAEYTDMDFSGMFAGDSVTLYFAVVADAELADYSAASASIAPDGDNLAVTWSDGEGGSFVLTKTEVTRALVIKSVTAENTTAGAINAYAVKKNDTVTFTVVTNAANASLTDMTFQGADSGNAWTPQDGPDADGFYTYTYEATVREDSAVADNEAAALEFSFNVGDETITQDSVLVNENAPTGTVLTYYAPLANLSAEFSVGQDPLVPEDCVIDGSTIILTIDVDRPLDFSVNELKIGQWEVPAESISYARDEKSISVALAPAADTQLIHESTFENCITLSILDECGVSVEVSINNGGDYTYLDIETEENFTYTMSVQTSSDNRNLGGSPSGSDAHLAIFSGETITYELHTTYPSRFEQYGLILELNLDGGSDTHKIDLVGNPDDWRSGYTYTYELNIGDIPGIAQGDEITIQKIVRNNTKEISAFSVKSAVDSVDAAYAEKVVFYSALQFTSLQATVSEGPLSNNTPSGETVYMVDEDYASFELALSHPVKDEAGLSLSLAYTDSLAVISGTKVSQEIFEGYAADLDTFNESLVYYLDPVDLDKIYVLYRLQAGDAGAAYQTERNIYFLLEDIYYQDLAETQANNLSTETVDENEDDFDTLVYWCPLNPSTFTTTVDAVSDLEDGYVRKGDTIQLAYTGITAEYIAQIDAGDNTTTFAAQQIPANGSFEFDLSGGNLENYTHGADVLPSFFVANAAGKTYLVSLEAGTTVPQYAIAPNPEENQLDISFDKTHFIDNSYHALTKNSSLSFSFYSDHILVADHTVILSWPGGNVQVPLVRVTSNQDGTTCNPLNGYTYTGTVATADFSGVEDYDNVQVAMRRNNSGLSFTDNLTGADITYFADLYLDGLNVSYPKSNGTFEWTPTDENAYIIDNDFLVITMVFNHSLIPAETTVQMDTAVGTQKTEDELLTYITKNPYKYTLDMGLQYYFTSTAHPNDTIVCLYRVAKPSDKEYEQYRFSFQRESNDTYSFEDNVPVTLQVNSVEYVVPDAPVTLDTGDYAPQKENGKEKYHQIIYWAPLDIWNPEVALIDLAPDENVSMDDFDAETYVIVRDGQTVRIQFATKHPVALDTVVTKLNASGISASEAPTLDLLYTETIANQSLYVYTASFTIGNAPLDSLDDLTILKFVWDLRDARNQPNKNPLKYSGDTKWAIYYQPLSITDITISSSNLKAPTEFCKDEDTIRVEFTTNHYVMLESSIIGKPVTTEDVRNRSRQKYSFTYTLANGDLEDLDEITFAFSIEDLAGDTFEFTDTSPSVINRLMYYAPIEVTASIKSNNQHPTYARNGDTVTISTVTSHTAQILDFRIGSREIGENKEYRIDPVVSYRIPENEAELYEGEVFFSIRVEDPAGNYELVSTTAAEGEEGSKVIYDRSAPQIRILPGFNGYTNQDVGFTFLYNDAHLDLSTLSCTLNGNERVHLSGGTNTTYTHEVALTEEGEYVVKALVVDMAGNEMEFAASCNLIIDKTSPVIQLSLERNTFRAGFTLDAITGVEEDHVGDMVCTITDNQGVHDWSLDSPINEEGKKTVYTMVRDMAGNTSVPLAFDIFIDGTAPQPWIANAATQEQFRPTGKNFFVGSTAQLDIALAAIHMGDEAPDQFTTLQLVDADNNLLIDFLATPAENQQYTYRLPEFGTYTLVVGAVDGVGNETGTLLYLFEFREQYLLERLLQNTPLANWTVVRHINDVLFAVICIVFVLLIAGIVALLIWRHRKKKEYMAQKYVIVDDK